MMAKWQNDKNLRRAEEKMENVLVEWMGNLEQAAVDAYFESTTFAEDALEYAREQGWQPPA